MRFPDGRAQRLQELLDYLDREGLDVIAVNWQQTGPRDMRIELGVVPRPREVYRPTVSNASSNSNYTVSISGFDISHEQFYTQEHRRRGNAGGLAPEGARPPEPEPESEPDEFGLGLPFDDFAEWL